MGLREISWNEIFGCTIYFVLLNICSLTSFMRYTWVVLEIFITCYHVFMDSVIGWSVSRYLDDRVVIFFFFFFYHKQYILIIVKLKRRMRDPSHKVQNLIRDYTPLLYKENY